MASPSIVFSRSGHLGCVYSNMIGIGVDTLNLLKLQRLQNHIQLHSPSKLLNVFWRVPLKPEAQATLSCWRSIDQLLHPLIDKCSPCLFLISYRIDKLCYNMASLILDSHTISQVTAAVGQTVKEHSNGTAFLLSFFTILVCEIGDKTFFLAMVMAMKYNQMVVFIGSYGALAVMTVLSTIFGAFITTIIRSKVVTGLIVAGLFFFFGGKLIYEAYHHPDDEEENQELKEVMEELKEFEQKVEERLSGSSKAKQAVADSTTPEKKKFTIPTKIILTQAFTMTFLAEWGDRSQIATISLAASDNAVMITLGALLGHLICTGGAVKLGQWISSRVKEKTVHYVGGVVFILSGLITLLSLLRE